jgi:hypothetical protein
MDRTRPLPDEQRQGSGLAQVVALRVLLWWLGHALVVAARFSAPLRSQITRSLIVEISTDDGVAMHWTFDSQRRRVSVSPHRAGAPDFALRFANSSHALRDLTSRRALDRIMADRRQRFVRIEGNQLILLWLHGLTRKLMPGGRETPRQPLPGAYVAHDQASNGVEKLTIEPAANQLDPHWIGAWNARAKLWIVRGANGEPLWEP